MLICIEGIDGSGKGTVTKKLLETLTQDKEDSVSCTMFSFPNYTGTPYGKIVSRYLNGEFGESTHPYLHNTLYSIDRFQTKPLLESLLTDNDCVILDRYVPSNVCYSAIKAKSVEERLEVAMHFLTFEHESLGLPLPDKIFYLDMPTKFAYENIAKKKAREYTNLTHDIHEADFNYLDSVNSFYRYVLPTLYAELDVPVIAIPCVESDCLRPFECIVSDIVNAIWS